jgi:ABC-type multidrug transport system fused ATPase/permease subunit
LQIFIDGIDATTIQAEHLRKHIALVSQEPQLFSTTVEENIRYGLDARKVTLEDVQAAAREANAHNFISEFKAGYQVWRVWRVCSCVHM